MKETILEIDGMSCQHCVKTVRGALEALPDVEVEDVDTERATVRYDETRVDPAHLDAAVADAGYEVTSRS